MHLTRSNVLQAWVLYLSPSKNVTAFIKKTQLFIYEQSNIYSKCSNIFTCIYTQSMSKLRVPPVKRFLPYISACHVIAQRIPLVLLTYFLIKVLGEMSIIYASAVHMCILIYDSTAIFMRAIYETSPFIKK